MAHLGCNLLPTWPILCPSWAHLRPNFAKNLHQIAPEISRSAPRDLKTTQGVARELQDSPWSLNFHGFEVDFGPHFKTFSAVSQRLSFNSSWPLGLKFKARGGLARAAHWIHAHRCMYICLCLYMYAYINIYIYIYTYISNALRAPSRHVP